MELRKAVLKDFRTFNKMYVKFDELFPINPMGKERYQSLVEQGFIYLAEEEKNIVGYAIILRYEDIGVRICHFFVKEKRNKLGSKFYTLLEEEIKKLGFNKIFLLCVTHEATMFWKNNGFTSIDGTEEFFKKLK